MPTKSSRKSFRLSISNPAEDVPRMLAGKGTACGGQFVLILRVDRHAVLLSHKVGKVSHLYTSTSSDCPRMPTGEGVKPADADKLVQAAKSNLPGLREPARRGTWRASLHCEDRPIIMLERKIASYGMVRICSNPDTGKWDWTAEREQRWHAGRDDRKGTGATLGEAILAVYAAADGLIAVSCAVRDTHRRGSRDAAYAETHPTRLPAERDPTAPRARKPRAEPAPAAAEAKPGRRTRAAAEPKPAPAAAEPKPVPAAAAEAKPARQARAPKRGADLSKDARLLDLFVKSFEAAAAG